MKRRASKRAAGALDVELLREKKFRSGKNPFQDDGDAFVPVASPLDDGDGDARPGRPLSDTRVLVQQFLRDSGIEVLWMPDSKGEKGTYYVFDANVGPIYKPESFAAVQARVQAWMGRGGVRGKDGRPQVVPSLARKMVESLTATYAPTMPPPPVWRTADPRTGERRPGDAFLVVGNGILDIAQAARNPRGRKVLLPHTPDFFATGMSAHLYLPRDKCPKFDKYLRTTFPDEGARNLFLQALGWLISGDRTIPNFLVLYGHKGTGKGVCVAIARALVGEGNHCSVPLHRFANPYVVGALAQYKANLVDEAPAGSIICERDKERGVVEGIVKQATGGYDARIMDDTKHVDSKGTTARHVKAANWFAFNPPFPSFKDPAIFDRIRALVFEQRFRNTRAEDVHLAEFIVHHEMSGVLNRALEGVEMLRHTKKLPTYAAGREIVRRSRCAEEADALALWLDERCEAKPGAFTGNAELFADWSAWCAELELDPGPENAFSHKVRGVWRDLSPEKRRGFRGLRGIVLKPIEARDDAPHPEEPAGQLGQLSPE